MDDAVGPIGDQGGKRLEIPGNLAESGDRGKSLHFAGLGRQTGAALVGRGHGQEVGDGDPLGRPAELVAAVAHVPAGDAVGNAEKIPRLCPRDGRAA